MTEKFQTIEPDNIILIPPHLNKEEYLALELTRIWCGQEGTVQSEHVISVYEKFKKRLTK